MSDEPAPVSRLDLNCDLAEHEPPEQTAALMALVSSANLACGGHAGDEGTLRRALQLARDHDVRAGAHPGLPGAFGRGDVALTPEAFAGLLREQLAFFLSLAAAEGVMARHVKLHGALYHATDHNPALRAVFLNVLRQEHPGLCLYARAGGATAVEGRAAGLTVWEEAFADRGYRDDGTLVPRDQPGALVTDPVAITERVRALAEGRPFSSVSGRALLLSARTVCVHGDSPQSVALLHAARVGLPDAHG